MKEGVLSVSTVADKQPAELKVYLFNDLLLFAKKKDKARMLVSNMVINSKAEFVLKGRMDLDKTRVILLADDEGMFPLLPMMIVIILLLLLYKSILF